MQPSTRTFQRGGKWVEKPVRTEVLICRCGAKYIKTREKQTSCIACMYAADTPPKDSSR